MRPGPLRLALLLLALPALSGAAAPPQLGAPLPAWDVVHWLGDGPRDPATPGLVTVLEFWASWSPASRLLLAEQDSLLAARPELPLQVVAISHEEEPALRSFLESAPWAQLTLGTDTAKGYWAETFDAVTLPEDGRRRQLPFAFILGEAEGSPPGSLLWMGSLVEIYDDDPLAAFQHALQAILAGQFDLAAERARLDEETRSHALMYRLHPALAAGDLATIDAALDSIALLRPHFAHRRTIPSNCNGIAWRLITEGEPTPARLATARHALALGLAHGGGEDAGFVDTQARLAWASGEREEALRLQRRALALATSPRTVDELRGTLNEYLAAMGRPPAPDDAPRLAAVTAAWSGTLNDAEAIAMAGGVVVTPAIPEDPERQRVWDDLMAVLAGRFLTSMRVSRADSVSVESLGEEPLFLYGTSEHNPAVRRLLQAYAITLTADGVRVGADLVPVENPILIAALPRPEAPAQPAVVYTAAREEDALNLNRFFHGPTQVVIGHWVDGKPVPVAALGVETDPATGQLRLALGPERVTGADLAVDLEQLHGQLRDGYAGYADIAWTLGRAGSSWAARTRDFTDRARERDAWAWADAFALLREYLEPVQDVHFTLSGTGRVAAGVVERSDRLSRDWHPWFTGLRVREAGGEYRVLDAPDTPAGFVGATLAPLPVLSSPHAARDGEAVLMPTFPGEPGARDYLVGCLGTGEPTALTLSLRGVRARGSRDRRLREAKLPLHRGRLAEAERSREPWSVRASGDGAATVAVRTMDPSALVDFPATADTLRARPALLLDLRGNGGGADNPAMEWVERLSGQSFQWEAFVTSWPEGRVPATRSLSKPGRALGELPNIARPAEPYGGRVVILTDKGVASSGETFVLLASQLHGALRAGENTGGCVSYGNVRDLAPLEHSRIRAHCGRSRFVQDWVIANREGVGIFPDYWLDTADPVADMRGALRALP